MRHCPPVWRNAISVLFLLPIRLAGGRERALRPWPGRGLALSAFKVKCGGFPRAGSQGRLVFGKLGWEGIEDAILGLRPFVRG